MSERWSCTRCGEPSELEFDKPCQCGCWWVTQQGEGWRHVGGPDWPRPLEKAPC